MVKLCNHINSFLTPIGELAYCGGFSLLISKLFQFFISKVGRFSLPKLAPLTESNRFPINTTTRDNLV